MICSEISVYVFELLQNNLKVYMYVYLCTYIYIITIWNQIYLNVLKFHVSISVLDRNCLPPFSMQYKIEGIQIN